MAAGVGRAAVPVEVRPVRAERGLVVAGHPEAAAAGLAVLKAGGNAVDAAVATSLALGVAEPYGSGLGGKLMLLYFDARTGRVHAVDAMDAAGSVTSEQYARLPAEERGLGYASVCVPGLAAGLWTAHQRWGSRPWAETVRPAIALAREGFLILAKTREQFEEQERKLRTRDAEIARLYLPGGELPVVGSRLRNEDLARTMEVLARDGRDGFYRGAVADAIAAAAQKGGGWIRLSDLAAYEARVVEPISTEVRGYTLFAGPPPTSGAALYLPILRMLEPGLVTPGALRSPENLDLMGRAWRVVTPTVSRTIGDVPGSLEQLQRTLSPESIKALRSKAGAGVDQPKGKSLSAIPTEEPGFSLSAQAATTHFIVVDGQGNIVCATQSQSFHFGAGVVAPGTGVVLNNSMSNFSVTGPAGPNSLVPGWRARSTIGPTIILRDGKAVMAVGVPGSARIPSALAQSVADRLLLGRPWHEAIGDTRVHFVTGTGSGEDGASSGAGTLEVEESFPAEAAARLEQLGWKVVRREPAGTGRYFGGINAIERNPDGSWTGFADPRRTNAAVGF